MPDKEENSKEKGKQGGGDEESGMEAMVNNLSTRLNTLIDGINSFTSGFYDNSMGGARIIASKLRLFGSAMIGDDLDNVTQEQYNELIKMKNKNPQFYEKLLALADKLSSIPLEQHPEEVMKIVEEAKKVVVEEE